MAAYCDTCDLKTSFGSNCIIVIENISSLSNSAVIHNYIWVSSSIKGIKKCKSKTCRFKGYSSRGYS